jgi:hypothetical protein
LEGSYISKWFTKKKNKYIYILTDCSVRSSTCVSQWFPQFLKLSPIVFVCIFTLSQDFRSTCSCMWSQLCFNSFISESYQFLSPQTLLTHPHGLYTTLIP